MTREQNNKLTDKTPNDGEITESENAHTEESVQAPALAYSEDGSLKCGTMELAWFKKFMKGDIHSDELTVTLEIMAQWRREARTVEEKGANEQIGLNRVDHYLTQTPADLSGITVAGVMLPGTPDLDGVASITSGIQADIIVGDSHNGLLPQQGILQVVEDQWQVWTSRIGESEVFRTRVQLGLDILFTEGLS